MPKLPGMHSWTAIRKYLPRSLFRHRVLFRSPLLPCPVVMSCVFPLLRVQTADVRKPVPHPEITQVDRTIKGQLSAHEQKAHRKCPDFFAVEMVAADPLVINPVTRTVHDASATHSC